MANSRIFSRHCYVVNIRHKGNLLRVVTLHHAFWISRIFKAKLAVKVLGILCKQHPATQLGHMWQIKRLVDHPCSNVVTTLLRSNDIYRISYNMEVSLYYNIDLFSTCLYVL